MGQQPFPEYPFSRELLRREDNMAVLDCRGMHLCGYVALADEAIPAEWRGNYDAPGLQFLAVHGGLTFAESENGWSVFGFDCGHAGDSDNPALSDPDHVLHLTRQMRTQLLRFADRWPEFTASDREGRCAILDEIRALAELEVGTGLGQMIEMLSGASSLGERA